jgi:hypothetical protein
MFSGFAAGSERVTFLSLALVLVARACWSGPSAQGCALEVPVYDRMANRLAFAITAVKEKDSGSDFLAADRHHRMKASGEWLYFPEVDLQRSFLITLSDAKSRKITVQVPLLDCHQRASVAYPTEDLTEYGGVRLDPENITTVSGRLAGCRIAGDWWVRMTPIFGQGGAAGYIDGYVEGDGLVAVKAIMSPGRYIIVIGKDQHPIKTLAVGVSAHKEVNVGEVDLSASCPQ